MIEIDIKKRSPLFNRKRSLLVVIIFSMAVLGAAIYWFVLENKWLSDDYKKQIKLAIQEEKFDNLYLYIQKAEAGVRGYASSGNKKYVSNIGAVMDSIRTNYIALKEFLHTENSSISNQVLAEFDSLVQEKIAFMEKAKKLCDEDNCEGALQLIATEKGLDLTSSILTINEKTSGSIKKSLQKSKERFEKLNSRNNRIAYIGIAAAMLVIILVFYLLRSEIKRTRQISKQLSIQKDYLRITLNSIGEGLIATSKDGKIEFMNPSAEELTGWNNKDARDQPLQKVYNIINEETGKPFEGIVSRILKEGTVVAFENNTILKTKNERSLVISNSGSPLLDKNGNVQGAVLVFKDITQQKINEAKIKSNEKRFRDMIQHLPEAVYTCDADGYIQHYNKAAVKLWGREPMVGSEKWAGSWQLYNTDGIELPLDESPMAITLKEGIPVLGKEVLVKRKDGSFRHVLTSPTPLYNDEGVLTGAVNMLIDVTDKKEKEILIRKTEERYRSFFEQASDTIITYSMDGTIHEVNDIIMNISGYSREEFVRLNLKDIIVGDIVIDNAKLDEIMSGKPVTLIRQFIRKDGSIVDIESRVKLLNDGKILAFGRDITERKKDEEEIREKNKQLQLLAEHLQEIREEERAIMAREIHDELGQQLTIMKMDIAWIQESVKNDDNTIVKRADELKSMLDQTINTVRRIAYELRPSMLDDMGLVAAIEWQLAEFEKRSGVKTEYSGSNSKFPLTNSAKTGLFRIVQESLTNVGRYAKASHVKVSLDDSTDGVTLKIVDNGVGFELEKLAFKKSLGIVGMKERCIMLGGEFKIESSIGSGTKIKVTVPHQKDSGKA